MKQKYCVLILEDSVFDAELMVRALRDSGIAYVATRVETRDSFETALKNSSPDLILSDYRLPAYNGREALAFVKENAPDTPVIVVSGALREEAAVELLKAGANDYVLKDRISRLPFAIKQVLEDAENAKARRETERLLRESEERFRNTIQYAPIGIGITTIKGLFVEVNQSICTLLGYTRNELLERNFNEITHSCDAEISSEHAKHLLSGEIKSSKLDMRCIRRDGKSVWVQVSVSLLRGSSGIPLNFIRQIEDITERRR